MNNLAIIEQVMIKGDLSVLSPDQRLEYYKAVCESVGLNPLTKPFDYITLNGKLVLYANKGCGEQLRQRHSIGLKVVAKEKIDDVYVVTAEAYGKDGRCDSATGAVAIAGLKGEQLANAFMKAETKAKRRVTLSICGLNMLDETEVESIPNAIKQEQAPRIIPDQPQADEGFNVSDGIWRFKVGQWNKKSITEVYNDEKFGPQALVKYLHTIDGHIVAGKYPDKHDLFKEAQDKIVEFLLDCEIEEFKQKARSFKMNQLEDNSNE